MAEYDTSIRVNTKVDNSDLMKVQKTFDDIEKSAKRTKKNIEGDFSSLSDVVEDYATRLKDLRDKGFGVGDKNYDDLYVAWKNAVNAEKEYLINLDKMTEKGIADEAAKATKEKEKQAEVQRKIEEAAEKNLQKETARLEKEIQLEAKLQAEAAEQARLKELKDSAVAADERLVELLQRQAELKAYLRDLEKAGVTAGYAQYDNASNELQQINDEVVARKKLTQSIKEGQEGFKQLSESCKKCLNAVQNGTKKSNGLLAVFGSRLKGIALSLFVFNWITKGFNAMVSAMKEGFQNLAQYSKEYNASMSALKSQTEQLKNSLAVAFEPIANIILPYLTQFVMWINTAADTFARFLAVLQGKSTYTKAKKQVIDYAKSLDTASKSAKGALASFDKLNVLNKDNGSASSGGGALTGGEAFETVSLTEEDMQMVDLLKEKLQKILAILLLIGLAMIVFGVGGPLATFIGALLTIVGLLEFILEYMDAWANGISFDNLQGMLIGLLGIITGIYILFGPLSAGIAAIVGGIALVVLAIKDMLDNGVNAQNSLTLAIGLVTALVGVFVAFGSTVGVIVGAITAVIAVFAAFIAIAGNGKEAIASLKSMCSNFAEFFKKIFAGDIKGAMESLKAAGKDFVNVVIIAFESLVNCLIKGLNWLIEKINTISFDVPDWVPGIGGKTMGFNIPSLQEVSLPRLANGAVIQGGRPFAAILGDQPAGQTNIESPLSTIEDAVQNVYDRNGGTGEINLNIYLDGEPVYKSVVKQDRMHQKATGHSAFAY